MTTTADVFVNLNVQRHTLSINETQRNTLLLAKLPLEQCSYLEVLLETPACHDRLKEHSSFQQETSSHFGHAGVQRQPTQPYIPEQVRRDAVDMVQKGRF